MENLQIEKRERERERERETERQRQRQTQREKEKEERLDVREVKLEPEIPKPASLNEWTACLSYEVRGVVYLLSLFLIRCHARAKKGK